MVFPPPQRTEVSVHCAGSRLTLPIREPQPSDSELRQFGPPLTSPPLPTLTLVEPKPFRREITTNQITGEVTTLVEEDSGLILHKTSGIRMSSWHSDSFSVHPDKPSTARGTSHWIKTYGRDDWQTRIEMTTTVCGLPDVWRIETHIIAHDGQDVVVDQTAVKQVARDLN